MRARVITNREAASGVFLLRLRCPSLAHSCQPGNFVMVRVSEGYSPLLRRPLSVSDVVDDTVSLMFEVRGVGTRLLSNVGLGQEIDLLGPLGNGFPDVPGGHDLVLVAGGVGIAPFPFLVRRLRDGNRRGTVHLFAGARTDALMPCLTPFRDWGVELWVATEDGSAGHRGMVSELFRLEGGRFSDGPATVFACGPWEMLKAVAGHAVHLGLPCKVSLESRMGCGVGACLGCAVPVMAEGPKGGGDVRYARACAEGPVFDAGYVVWS